MGHAAFSTLADRAVHVLRQLQHFNQICKLFHGKRIVVDAKVGKEQASFLFFGTALVVHGIRQYDGERVATQVPYGYLKGEDGRLVVDEETAWVVKLIFDLCVQGLGIGKIASELTRRNIPTPGTVAFYRYGHKRNYHPDSECQ